MSDLLILATILVSHLAHTHTVISLREALGVFSYNKILRWNKYVRYPILAKFHLFYQESITNCLEIILVKNV